MEKIIIILIGIIALSGCAHGRYKGWQYVRIEKQLPGSNCEYKIQEACSESGAECYNWYKKRAVLYGANTVVVTEDSRSWQQRGSEMSGRWKGDEVVTALADYYYCPGSKDRTLAP